MYIYLFSNRFNKNTEDIPTPWERYFGSANRITGICKSRLENIGNLCF